MNHLPRVRVAAIWCISTWPALNFVMLNIEEIAGTISFDPGSCLGILVFTLAFGAAGHLLHAIASRKSLGGVVVLAWLSLVVALFGYSMLGRGVEQLQELFGWHLAPMPVWICFVAVLAIIVMVSLRFEKLQVAAVLFCIVTGVTTTFLFVTHLLTFEPRQYDAAAWSQAIVNARAARVPGLNAYYILLDSYPGRDTVLKQTGHDNGEFIARMAERGFVEASTGRSNYLETPRTLGAIFALDYPFTENPHTWTNSRARYPDVFGRSMPPPLIRRLSEDGYVGYYSPSPWSGCVAQYLKCLLEPKAFEPDNLTRSFLDPTPFGNSLATFAAQYYDALSTVEDRLPKLLATGKPFFVFAHHMSPHPPFLRDANCHPRSGTGNRQHPWQDSERPAFANEVKCVNLEVARLVDAILRVNPEAIIVLQGDHGSSFSVRWDTPIAEWTAEEIAERSSYLNLIRAPENCRRWLDRPLGQANTARFVLACLEGKPPVYLPERSYLTTYSQRTDRGVVVLAPPAPTPAPATQAGAAPTSFPGETGRK